MGAGKIMCSVWVIASGLVPDEYLVAAASFLELDPRWLLRPLIFFAHHQLVLALLDMCIGILLAGAAMCFLRGHAWARTGIEAIFWGAVVITVADLVFWQAFLRTFADTQAAEVSRFGALAARGAYISTARLIVLVPSIWFLRRQSARSAFIVRSLRADEA